MREFGGWVAANIFDPHSPMLREARSLFSEEIQARDTLLYNSVLAAVAAGDNKRGSIAARVGRKSADLAHSLEVLEDAGYLRKEPDAFNARRPVWRLADPIMAFHYAVMRPVWHRLEVADDVRGTWHQQQHAVIDAGRGNAQFELDVVVHGRVGDREELLAIGEARVNETMTQAHRAGFSRDLRRLEADGAAILVDLKRIYEGS